ncbi:MAG: hypothetical protein AAGD25_03830 [Cyanobacteria bacterium P01_F01_bin.150]
MGVCKLNASQMIWLDSKIYCHLLSFGRMLKSKARMRRTKLNCYLIITFCTALLTAGCTITSVSDSPNLPLDGSATEADTSTELLNQTETELPSSDSEMLSTDVEKRMLDAIAMDLSVNKESLRIDSIAAQTWADGCLGLGTNDELCTMALVEGWYVQVSSEDGTKIYRSNKEGTVIRRAG